MTTATITKPKTKKVKPKRKASPTAGSNAPCENCAVKANPEKKTSKKKKKPMFKLGCWRGVFKGTPDF